MKAKHLLLSSAALLSVFGLSGCVPKTNQNLPVDILRASDWSDFVEGEHDYGSSYHVPTMTYTIDGVSYPASVIVTFPDGNQSAEPDVLLNQAGVYTFEYSVKVGEKVHNITKQIQVGFPQVYVENHEKSSLKYISAEESKALGAAGTGGIYVQLGSGDTLNFSKPIYLDEMNDSTALLKGYITPSNKGSVDFGQLFIKLTDADDPNKFVIVCYYSHIETNADGRTAHSSSVMAKSDAQSYFAGWHQSQGLHTNDTWGLWSGVSFDGYMKDKAGYKDYTDEALFVFGFDHSSKTAYGTGFGKGSTLDMVLDLDDVPNSVSSPWSGFTSNRAYMSVYAESYSGSTANFVISEIAGVSSSDLAKNSFVDSEGPEITIEGDYESLTNGVAGYYYPIPKATSYDQVSKECPVTAEVFYNYFSDDRTNVKIQDGKFFMEKQGTYTICFTSYDKAGNKAQKLHTISVFDALEEISFSLPPHLESQYVGEYVAIDKKVEISGGVGSKRVEVYYEVDGKRHLVEGNGFRIEELKAYKVIYKAVDAIGQSVEKSYDIAVTDGHKPILEKEICYPKYFISGGYYEFPSEKVYLYENGKLLEKVPTLEVSDSNGTKEYHAGEEINPVVNLNGQKVTIKTKYGETTLQTDEVYTVLNIGTEQSARAINLSNYFVSENLKKELTSDDGMKLISSSLDAAYFDFATPFLLDSFTLSIKSLMGFADGSGIKIRLTDYADHTKQIEAAIFLKGETTYFQVGDKAASFVNNDINAGDNAYDISYEDGSFSCGSLSLPVSKTLDGEQFDGFTSKKAYLTLAFDNAPVGASLNVITLCQAGFSSKTARDRVSPLVQMDDNYGGSKDINSLYHIAPASSFDVFSPNVLFKLSVLSPSGEYMTATDGTLLKEADPNKGYDILLNEYGQYYFTLSTIEDPRFLSNGTELTISYYVTVYDDLAPNITFSSGMASTAKVGESVLLPQFEVSDNLTSKEDIVVQRVMLSPSGIYHYLDSSYNAYTFKEAGEYRFIIHVIDKAGNIVTKTFLIDVSEA